MFIEVESIPSKYFSCYGLNFIIASGKRRKHNVLILTPRQQIKDQMPSPCVLSSNQSEALKNILKHLASYENCKMPANLFVYDIHDDAIEAPTIDLIKKLIRQNNIDVVVTAGFNIAASLLDTTQKRAAQLRGRFINCPKLNCPIVPTFQLAMAMSDDPKHWKTLINLLGFVKQDLETAFRAKNRYDIDTDIDYTVITTIKQWRKFYKKLAKAPLVSLDTEGKNLNRRFDNVIYIAQFSIERDFSYIVPLDHSQTPFNSKELREIKRDIKTWFETASHCTIICQNGKYDFTIAMSFLNVEYIAARIYDISVGEMSLDENRKYMWDVKIYDLPAGQQFGKPQSLPAYTLETILAQYCGKFPYDDSTIGKKDRMNLNDHALIDVAPYCARDTIYPWRIMEAQIAEAKRRGGFYNKHMLNVTELGAAMQHIFVEMEHNGILVDDKYLNNSMAPNSLARQQLAIAESEIYKFPSALKTNDILLASDENKGMSESLLTGKPWVFDIATQRHQQIFFIKVLKLAYLKSRKNEDASLDKTFLQMHENQPEVIAYKDLNDLKKMFNDWLKKLAKELRTKVDFQDNHIAAIYDFLGVTTWRTSARNPAFQTIPNHGAKAKPIKKIFIAPWLGIQIGVDYNAHEIRVWGNLGQDKKIANAFLVGIKLRRELRIWQAQNFDIANETYAYFDKIKWDKLEFSAKEKIAKKLTGNQYKLAQILLELQRNGDFHRNSYAMFFNVSPESVTSVQRQSSKTTSFGSIYGKFGETLGEDLNQNEVRQIKLANPDADRNQLRKLLRPYHEMGSELIDRLFFTYKKGHDWILAMQEIAAAHYRVVSPLGPLRHLWIYFLNHKSLSNRADRLASNAINQGMASNLAYIGARIFQTVKFKAKCQGVDLHTKINNMVHDSLKLEITNIINIMFTLYFLEHSLLSQTAKASDKIYGFPLMLGLEAEFEIGFNAADMVKYSYTEHSFFAIIHAWIKAQEAHYGQEIPAKKALLAYLKASYRFVETHRAKELKTVKSYEPETTITLTLDKIKKFQDNDRNYQKFILATQP